MLDGSGLPVVSYYDVTNDDLKVLHCNDANCTGGGDSLATVDTGTGDAGSYPSVALDSTDYPVVSYSDNTHGEIWSSCTVKTRCVWEVTKVLSPWILPGTLAYTAL